MATATKAKYKVYPLADRVAIRPMEETETMKGGLYIPDTAKEKPIQGEIIAVGPGRREKGRSAASVCSRRSGRTRGGASAPSRKHERKERRT